MEHTIKEVWEVLPGRFQGFIVGVVLITICEIAIIPSAKVFAEYIWPVYLFSVVCVVLGLVSVMWHLSGFLVKE